MKFMKLGTRPDTFFTADEATNTRSVSSEVSTDIKIQVQNTSYLLHKFPLLSKCSRLQSLCSSESKDSDRDPDSDSHEQIAVELHDIPGGADAFEVCAKFCYGITVTLSALNLVPVYCAACYLQMAGGGNLVEKLDAFLRSCVLRRWKDALVTLRGAAARQYAPLCEELGVTSRCVDALASKVLAHPSRAEWTGASKRWWAEDVSELGIDLYWRIMLAVKSAGTVPGGVVGEAVQAYACRWLQPQCNDVLGGKMCSDKKQRLVVEKLSSLLPSEKGAVSCSFLLRLLGAANVLGASQSTKLELARRVGVQLEEATVSDLLIPTSPSYVNETMYDVEIVMSILEEFMLQGQSPPTSPPRGKKHGCERRSRSAENVEFEGRQENSRRSSSSAAHSSKLRVAKLIDCYLQEIAGDANLPMEKVIVLAEAVQDFARPDHDDLYKVIDTYLRAHPDLDKSARKQLCRILNCKKLSMEACTHAVQNELLPLRVVVQVLFFEQARAAISGGHVTELPSNIRALLATTSAMHDDKDAARFLRKGGRSGVDPMDGDWSISGLKCPESKLATLRMKLAEGDNDDVDDDEILNRDGLLRSSSSRFKALSSIPTKPKRILSKLWSMNRSVREGP